jgi:hypothetical protein
MGTHRKADHEKRARVVEELAPKLELAHAHAKQRLEHFPDEIAEYLHGQRQHRLTPAIVQQHMVTDVGRVEMEKVLPQEEPGSIQWEGGEEHKGDDPADADAKKQTEIEEGGKGDDDF